MAALSERFLRPRQRLARCDAELRLHQIHAGHSFGDRMLDLEAGVHLQEIEPLVPDPRDGSTRNSMVPAFR